MTIVPDLDAPKLHYIHSLLLLPDSNKGQLLIFTNSFFQFSMNFLQWAVNYGNLTICWTTFFFISPAECHYSRMRNFSRGLCGTRRRERRPVHYRLQHPKCSSRGKPNYRDTRSRSPGSQQGVDQHMCHTNQSKDNSARPSTTRR